jgi:hypothetical protein
MVSRDGLSGGADNIGLMLSILLSAFIFLTFIIAANRQTSAIGSPRRPGDAAAAATNNGVYFLSGRNQIAHLLHSADAGRCS